MDPDELLTELESLKLVVLAELLGIEDDLGQVVDHIDQLESDVWRMHIRLLALRKELTGEDIPAYPPID
jgi:hypothetical protein